ncbi:MAG: SHOCT domain-containing protein [Gammaproteobacteria bacterium]|nr:SHOCT domain-containing protein [Gammaproteobacteria bacterium]
MMGDIGNFGWGMGFGWLFMLIFWGLVILGIAALVKWMVSSRGEPREKTPLEILRERYARGEIGRDEYEQKKRDLQG